MINDLNQINQKLLTKVKQSISRKEYYKCSDILKSIILLIKDYKEKRIQFNLERIVHKLDYLEFDDSDLGKIDYCFSNIQKIELEKRKSSFDSILFSVRNVHRAINKNKYSLIDSEYNYITDIKYDSIDYLDYNNYLVRFKDRVGMINEKNETILDVKYSDISKLFSKFYCVKLNNKVGVVNKKGNSIIEIKYSNISIIEFNRHLNLFIVIFDDKYSLLDNNFNFVLEPKYSFINIIDLGNQFKIIMDDRVGVVDRNFNYIIKPEYDRIFLKDKKTEGEHKIYELWKNGNKFFANSLGKIIVNYEDYDRLDFNYKNNYINMIKKNKFSIKNLDGITVFGEYEIDNNIIDFNEMGFLDDMCEVTLQNNKKGFINKNLELVFETDFNFLWGFYDGLCAFSKEGKVGFIDKKGNIVLNPIYEMNYNQCLYKFNENICSIQIDGKFGIINKNGNFIEPPKHINPIIFNNGVYIISDKENGKIKLFNSEGTLLLDIDVTQYENREWLFSAVGFFNENLCCVELKNNNDYSYKYVYIDKKGTVKINTNFVHYGESNAENLQYMIFKNGISHIVSQREVRFLDYDERRCDHYINKRGNSIFSNDHIALFPIDSNYDSIKKYQNLFFSETIYKENGNRKYEKLFTKNGELITTKKIYSNFFMLSDKYVGVEYMGIQNIDVLKMNFSKTYLSGNKGVIDLVENIIIPPFCDKIIHIDNDRFLAKVKPSSNNPFSFVEEIPNSLVVHCSGKMK
ncbi:MAG: WG repeat-containing protein [Promethearchaeota archaeon]